MRFHLPGSPHSAIVRVDKSVALGLPWLYLNIVMNDGQLHFGTQQAAEKLGISKQTLLRWFREGRATDPAKRDRNGWRIFDQSDIDSIKQQVAGL